MVDKGEWDHLVAVLGVPKTGKSTWALALAVELGRTPAYVVAHDPGMSVPSKIPDGRGRMVDAGVRRHASIADAQRALATDPRGVHAIATPDADEVLQLGKAIGQASLAAGGGARGVPVVVVIDEAVAAASASAHRLGPALREAYALRRHHHVGIVICCQDPRLTHYSTLSLATEIVMFRITDEKAIAKLATAGVPSEILAVVPSLPNHSFVTFKLGGK